MALSTGIMADSILHRLGRRAKDIGERAAQELLTEEQRARALGKAAKSVQHGRRMLDENGAKLLVTLGLATQTDLEKVTQKVGKLRKRLERLLDSLED